MKSYMNALSLYQESGQEQNTWWWKNQLAGLQPTDLSEAALTKWRETYWGSQVVPFIQHVALKRDAYSNSSKLFEHLNQEPRAERGSHAYIRSYNAPLTALTELLVQNQKADTYLVLGWAAEDGSEAGAKEFGPEHRRLCLPSRELSKQQQQALRLAVNTFTGE